MSKLIRDLDFSMQPKANDAFNEMNKNERLKDLGCDGVAIVETKRELTTQMAYYSKGRMPVADVKRMYAAAGLYDPSEEECKKIVTKTLQSKHIQGRAIDFCPVKDGKLWWTAPNEVWQEMGLIGESCGLIWGGRWKEFQDCPHFEY